MRSSIRKMKYIMLQYKSMSKGNIYKATREERETFISNVKWTCVSLFSIPK